MPIKTINDPVYRVRITFIFDEEKNKAVSFLKKWTGNDLSHMWNCAGFVCSSDDYKQEFYLVLTNIHEKNWLITSTLAHECLHITARVLRAINVQLSEESEETFTYYLTWLMEELTIIFNNHQKRAIPMKKAMPKMAKKSDIKAAMKKDKKDDMKMMNKMMMKKGKK